MSAWRDLIFFTHFFNLLSGGHSSLDPRLPIPNSTVKRVCADDSVPFAHANVGYRQANFSKKARARKSAGLFCLAAKLTRSLHQRSAAVTSVSSAQARWRFESVGCSTGSSAGLLPERMRAT